MKIRFDDVTEDGLELDAASSEFQESWSSVGSHLPENVRLENGMTGRIWVALNEGEVLLSAKVKATVQLNCSRCLTTYTMESELTPSIIIRPRASEDLLEEADDPDSSVVFGDEDSFDVAEILVQELMLELPMKPLCADDCPGLCAQCGKIKGSPDCTCSDEQRVDPRWQTLEDLKKRMSQ